MNAVDKPVAGNEMNQTTAEPDRHATLRAKHVREARQALVLIAVLQMAAGVFLYFDLRDGDKAELLVALLLQALIPIGMLGLRAWSRHSPRGALATALVVWCALLFGTITVDPRTAVYGGVIGVVVTMVLFRGARAAIVQASLERTRRH